MSQVWWWQRWPGWIEYELEALDIAGIPWKRDDAAFRRGIFRLQVSPTVDGERVDLIATYPDLYPYFRFEVQAKHLRLNHHQNPFGKNLCLLPRGTFHWDPELTLADVLNERLETVLRTGCANDPSEADGLEQRQAEPRSTYYEYAPSMIIVQSDWKIPAEHQHGTLIIGTDTHRELLPNPLVRGVVLEIHGQGGQLLKRADKALRQAFRGRTVAGMWVREPMFVETANADEFAAYIVEAHPAAGRVHANQVIGGLLSIWGVLFPDEVGWRSNGDGWVFVCRFEKSTSGLSGPHFDHRPNRKPQAAAKQKRKRKKQR